MSAAVMAGPWPEPAETAPVLTFIAYGMPGPQGSKSPKGYRRSRVTGKTVPVLVESSAKVKPWRDAVAAAARRRLSTRPGWALLDCALEVEMRFTVPRPQRMPAGRIHPSVYPDLSKLARSTEDALTGIVWKDDGLVIAYRGLSKTYPHLGPHAMARPGVIVRIWRAAS